MAKFEIEVYKCDVCGEIPTIFDMDEHCMWCENTIDSEDWTFLGKYVIEADNLSEACDKAIQMAKEVDSNEQA